MKGILNGRVGYYTLTVLLFISFLIASVPTSKAQEVVVLFPGGNEQINFFLPDTFALHGFTIITLGNAETLSITLSTQEKSGNPLFKMYYMLLGLGYSFDEGAQFILENASTPSAINTSITINSSFGIAFLGAAITRLEEKGDFGFPALFTLTLGLSEEEDEGPSLTAEITSPSDGSEFEAEEIITFQGTGNAPDGTIVSYSWDFGDGNTASGQTVTHAYLEEGDYTVSLTVTDDVGATATDSISIAIASEDHDDDH